MNTCKRAVFIAVYCALLIGGQLALSSVVGVEVVTVLSVCFCFYFGIVSGIITMTLFSLLRCLIFGFFPTVIILYLVYYNLLAVVYGLMGRFFKREIKRWWQALIFVAVACVMTVVFTLLDDVITPLYMGMSEKATYAYFYSSLPIMGMQTLSVSFTVSFLFVPVLKSFKLVRIR